MKQAARVLVVNDSLKWLESIREVLQRAGFDVIGLTNGHDALAECEAGKPAAIVLDYHLGNGVTAADFIRKFEKLCPGVPIGIVSATDVTLDPKQLGVRFFVPLDTPAPGEAPHWESDLTARVRECTTC